MVLIAHFRQSKGVLQHVGSPVIPPSTPLRICRVYDVASVLRGCLASQPVNNVAEWWLHDVA